MHIHILLVLFCLWERVSQSSGWPLTPWLGWPTWLSDPLASAPLVLGLRLALPSQLMLHVFHVWLNSEWSKCICFPILPLHLIWFLRYRCKWLGNYLEITDSQLASCFNYSLLPLTHCPTFQRGWTKSFWPGVSISSDEFTMYLLSVQQALGLVSRNTSNIK